MDAFFLLGASDEIFIQRYHRDNVPVSLCQEYISTVRKHPFEEFHQLPSGRVAVTVTREGLRFAAAISKECSSVLLLDCLNHIADNLSLYFEKEINETIVRENYSSVLVLLEEMLDFGLPSMMEYNALLMLVPSKTLLSRAIELISPSRIFSGLFSTSASLLSSPQPTNAALSIIPAPGDGMGTGSGMGASSGILGAGSSIWWRRGDTSYVSDEIQVDVLEDFNCIINKSGKVLSNYIGGQILIRSRLSGIPNCQLIFRNPEILDKNNVSFHPCVNKNKWKDDHTLSFIPPDGLFSLCQYSFQNITLIPPVDVNVNFDFPDAGLPIEKYLCKFEILLIPRGDFANIGSNSCSSEPLVIEKVKLIIQLPQWIEGITTGETTGGFIKYNNGNLIWSIARLPLESTRTLRSEGTLELKNDNQRDKQNIINKTCEKNNKISQLINLNEDFNHTIKPNDFRCTVQMQFLIKDWIASRLSIDSLEVIGTKTNNAFKGVRRATAAGSLEFRL